MSPYCAFISYSHSDARFAAWLQRKLEGFRIPPATVQKLKLNGNRLGPVFRDVADLGAATKLTTALIEALTKSRALIVICSPESVASKWVGMEVEQFRRLHGENALVLPIVSPKAGTDETERMFPEALGESSPLAADARRSVDGRRIALLKIVAGLLGTGLDELIQRDTRRRHARLVGAISATTALALVMAVLAVLAISAREDAKRRLSQSEDLISFMLGDLREQLTPLGQVGVLASVGAKALTYFESLDDKDLTEAALLRKSRALYQIGEVYFELGEFSAAHNSFGLSLEQARQLAAAQPKNVDRLFEWSQAEFWAGFAAWNFGDLDKAMGHLESYHDLAWALLELEPDNSDWKMETFWASNNLGGLAYKQGKYSDALVHFEDAIIRISALIDAESTVERLLEKASTLAWLGSTHFHLGELTLSEQFFLRALEEPLDPNNALHNLERSHFLGLLSETELYQGKTDSARIHAIRALDIARALSESDPDSTEFLYAETTLEQQLALLNSYAGLPIAFEELTSSVDQLFQAENTPPSWLAVGLRTAEIGLRSRKPGSLTWAKTVLYRVDQDRAGWEAIAGDHLNLVVSAAEGDPTFRATAEALLPELESIYERTRDFYLVLPLIRCYKLLGRQAEATAAWQALVKSESSHPAFERLRASD